MKRKIFTLTIIFILAGTIALGYGITLLTQDEAYQAALENDRQTEINELNLQLQQITYDKSVKEASHTAVDTYFGKLTKYITPFNNETNLEVKKRTNEKALEQLKIDIVSKSYTLAERKKAYSDAMTSLDVAVAEYEKAAHEAVISQLQILLLQYTAESKRISLIQAENNLISAEKDLEYLLGQNDTTVELPENYSNPYTIDFTEAYEATLEKDTGVYQAARNVESNTMKLEIAEQFYNKDETTYISVLSALKSARLSYEKSLISLELSVLADIDNLKNKYDVIELEKLNNKIKLSLYQASLSQYEAGIISITSLKDTESAYALSKTQLSSKITEYIMATMRFTLDTGYSF